MPAGRGRPPPSLASAARNVELLRPVFLTMNRLRPLALAFTLVPLLALAAESEDGEAGKKSTDKYPEGVSANDTAEMALKKFSVAPGLRVDVWAAEPLLANPIAFC